MRILATAAGAFSAAVFAACLLFPERWLLHLGLCALAAGLLTVLFRRRRKKPVLRAALILFGAAAGLLWTAAFQYRFFTPARALHDHTVRLTATVTGWPRETKRGFSVLTRAETDSGASLQTILYTDEQGGDLRPGDRVTAITYCTDGRHSFNGEEITYYLAKGVFLRGVTYGRLEVERPEKIPIKFFPVLLSQKLKAGIDGAFPADAAPLVRALVTGNRDNLTDRFTTSLQRTGLSHTVAVSGMHLAFLTSLLTLLLGRGKRSTALLTILWAVLFCGVAGNTPSAVRAAIMIFLLEFAPLVERERDDCTALAAALMLLLLWNPLSAAHVGLQLSFGAVAGIIVASNPIKEWLITHLKLDYRPKRRVLNTILQLPRFVVDVFAATAGASLFTVPLVAVHFNTISLIAPLSNLLSLWAVALLFLGGLLTGLLAMFSPAAAQLTALLFTPLARYLNAIIPILSKPALAALPLDSGYYRGWLLFFYLILGLLFLTPGKRRYLVPGCCCVLALVLSIFCTARSFQQGRMTAVVLDVGQGQSVILRTGDMVTLVDCGGFGGENAGDAAANYLQSHGRRRVDLLVLSHYDADHVNGVSQLLERMEVSAIALPDVHPENPYYKEIAASAEVHGIPLNFIREDTRWTADSGEVLTVFAPLASGLDRPNDEGLTVLATAGEDDVLITGDMGWKLERILIHRIALPDVELMVAGHHGSRHSNSKELLEAVKPDTVVISAGLGNPHDHPAPETLERLEKFGADIYRTDLNGTVTLRYNGG